MKSTKHGVRASGLLALAALGVMAWSAVTAQAQSFLVNLGTPAGHAATGEQLGTGYLLVQARDLKIECSALHVTAGVINNSTDGKAKILFLGCVAKSHAGVSLEGCEFKELGGIQASALVLPRHHGGQRYLLFEPLEGGVLAIILFKAGQGCVLPLTNPVTGAVAAKVESELEGITQTIIFSEAIQLLFGDVLKYGALNNTSYLNGIGHIKLVSGFKLGIH